jgi:hypothetical protein
MLSPSSELNPENRENLKSQLGMTFTVRNFSKFLSVCLSPVLLRVLYHGAACECGLTPLLPLHTPPMFGITVCKTCLSGALALNNHRAPPGSTTSLPSR